MGTLGAGIYQTFTVSCVVLHALRIIAHPGLTETWQAAPLTFPVQTRMPRGRKAQPFGARKTVPRGAETLPQTPGCPPPRPWHFYRLVEETGQRVAPGDGSDTGDTVWAGSRREQATWRAGRGQGAPGARATHTEVAGRRGARRLPLGKTTFVSAEAALGHVDNRICQDGQVPSSLGTHCYSEKERQQKRDDNLEKEAEEVKRNVPRGNHLQSKEPWGVGGDPGRRRAGSPWPLASAPARGTDMPGVGGGREPRRPHLHTDPAPSPSCARRLCCARPVGPLGPVSLVPRTHTGWLFVLRALRSQDVEAPWVPSVDPPRGYSDEVDTGLERKVGLKVALQDLHPRGCRLIAVTPASSQVGLGCAAQ